LRRKRRRRAIRVVAVESATVALAATAAFAPGSDWAPEPVIAAVSDTALPGEGRPPSPGPNNPDGPT
jgi:hypothetical protein